MAVEDRCIRPRELLLGLPGGEAGGVERGQRGDAGVAVLLFFFLMDFFPFFELLYFLPKLVPLSFSFLSLKQEPRLFTWYGLEPLLVAVPIRRGASVECGGGCGGRSATTAGRRSSFKGAAATARAAASASSRAITAGISWDGGRGGVALRTARRDVKEGRAPAVAPVAVVVAAAAVAGPEPPCLSPLRRSLRKKPPAAEAAAAATLDVDAAAVLLPDGDRERPRASLFDFFFFLASRLPVEVEGGGRAVVVAVATATNSSNSPPSPLPCPRIALEHAVTKVAHALKGE